MLTQATDITALGFDGDLLGISDNAVATTFIEASIAVASDRLESWLNDSESYAAIEALANNDRKKIRVKRAELLLTLVEILPLVHAQASVGENSVTVEGFSVKLTNVTPDESVSICRALADKAYVILRDSAKPAEYTGVALL
jgi:hypothetical protein